MYAGQVVVTMLNENRLRRSYTVYKWNIYQRKLREEFKAALVTALLYKTAMHLLFKVFHIFQKQNFILGNAQLCPSIPKLIYTQRITNFCDFAIIRAAQCIFGKQS